MVRCFPLVLLALLQVPPAWAGDVSLPLPAGDGFTVKDNTGAIERLRVDDATGNVSRNGALFVHTTGADSLFVGAGAGSLASSGAANVGVGPGALLYNTTGSGNSAFGEDALTDNQSGNTNSAFGRQALTSNVNGFSNDALGSNALLSNLDGNSNAAFGENALSNNTSGRCNATFGASALLFDTTGEANAAVGIRALRGNTTGYRNAATGWYALRANTDGHQNSGFGALALFANTTGDRNLALGNEVGSYQTTGSDNIYIANQGAAGESGQIKIGAVGTHAQATVAGIHGNTSPGGIAMLVDANGVLGTTTSSTRFKRDVRDRDDARELLMALRPVAFRYREEIASSSDGEESGLLAEEVAKVAPQLVALDAEGRPYSVRYHVLPALLLAVAQEQQRTIETLQAQLEAMGSAPAEAGKAGRR